MFGSRSKTSCRESRARWRVSMPLLPLRTFRRMARDRGARRENCGATCTASQPSLCLYCCGGNAVPNPVINMDDGSVFLGSVPAKGHGKIYPLPETFQKADRNQKWHQE